MYVFVSILAHSMRGKICWNKFEYLFFFFFLIQGQGQLNFNLLTFLKFEFFIVLDKRFQTKLSISSIAFFNLRKV